MPKHKQFKYAYRSSVILRSSPMQTDIILRMYRDGTASMDGVVGCGTHNGEQFTVYRH